MNLTLLEVTDAHGIRVSAMKNQKDEAFFGRREKQHLKRVRKISFVEGKQKGENSMSTKYQGFVPIPRDIQTLPFWGNAYDTTLWLYCVLHTSHQPYRGLQPGQFYASQARIAETLHWSRKTVSVSLRRLESKGLLGVRTSDRGTVITVMYWEEISSGKGVGNKGTGDENVVLSEDQGEWDWFNN